MRELINALKYLEESAEACRSVLEYTDYCKEDVDQYLAGVELAAERLEEVCTKLQEYYHD